MFQSNKKLVTLRMINTDESVMKLICAILLFRMVAEPVETGNFGYKIVIFVPESPSEFSVR